MRVYLIAGEASGDKLGAALIEGLRALCPGEAIEFVGIGGARMTEAGLESLFPMDEISVMGVAEILRDYLHLRRRLNETVEHVLAVQPDVLITIDLPEFSLRVAKAVKQRSAIRTVHYVAPTVWAWRPGRAEKMARHIDQVLALLPFEPPYMEAAGMRCDFVGHPVVTDPVASRDEADAFRATQGGAPLVLVLPGSRRSEVARLATIFRDAAAAFAARSPRARFVIPAAPAVEATVREAADEWPVPVTVIGADDKAGKRAAFRAADVALAASGTVSLELAANDTPMVIAYDMSWLSRQIIGRLVTVDTVTLVNLVSDTRTVPEFIGPDCQPGPIAAALQAVIDAPEAQRAAMALTMERLGRGGPPPGERAARAVLEGMGHNVC